MKEKRSFFHSQEMTLREAMGRILAMRHRLQQLGNNDVESSMINAYIEQMNSGKMRPQEAVQKVQDMMDSRNER